MLTILPISTKRKTISRLKSLNTKKTTTYSVELPAPGLRLPAPSLRPPAPGLRPPAPGLRPPAPGSRSAQKYS